MEGTTEPHHPMACSFVSAAPRSLSKRRRGCPARRWLCQAPTPDAPTATTPFSPSHAPLLLRALRGEQSLPRPPVWLMRQAGRYMSIFRDFSDKYTFRERSENADIARELSLQPLRAFGVDAVILFSDILTPLPALGFAFDIQRGRGPVIAEPVRCAADVDTRLRRLESSAQAAFALPFVGEALRELQATLADAPDRPALLGFIGAPFTLAAYLVEGESGKSGGQRLKRMIYSVEGQRVFQRLLSSITDSLAEYAVYQIDSGADAVQLFDSWAHHLPPTHYPQLSLQYSMRLATAVHERRPDVPLILYANGSCGKLRCVREALRAAGAVRPQPLACLGLDWKTNMSAARRLLGRDMALQGNLDPMLLEVGERAHLKWELEQCVRSAAGGAHIVNLGHGVTQSTPESMVAALCEYVQELEYTEWYRQLSAEHASASAGENGPLR